MFPSLPIKIMGLVTQGVLNGTAPKPVRMSEFCSTLGGIMGRPSWLPVPDFALTTLLGEGASVVLEGQKVNAASRSYTLSLAPDCTNVALNRGSSLKDYAHMRAP